MLGSLAFGVTWLGVSRNVVNDNLSKFVGVKFTAQIACIVTIFHTTL
ncbi:MAG: hypothetical protein ACI9UN_000164 [Granulosicoccus sp.]|jgi:hypothetical protein